MSGNDSSKELAAAINRIAEALEQRNRIDADNKIVYARSIEIQERQLASTEDARKLQARWTEVQEENARSYQERLKGHTRQQQRGLLVLGILMVVLIVTAIIAAVYSNKSGNQLSQNTEPTATPARGIRNV